MTTYKLIDEAGYGIFEQGLTEIDLLRHALCLFGAQGREAQGTLDINDRKLLLKALLCDFDVPVEEDVGYEFLDDTPARVAKWLHPLAAHEQPPVRSVFGPLFQDSHDEMVVVKDIGFVAVCEHHLLPFKGRAHVGYVPNGVVMGLSKAARVVHYYTEHPTLQEHITTQVADALMTVLEPKGVMVVLQDVMHSCMTMRGVKDPDVNTTTSAVRGVFKTDPQPRNEFLSLIA